MMPSKPKKEKKAKPNIGEITQCPECGSTHLIKDNSRDELVCEDCGLVIDEDFIDHGPEWRHLDSNQKEKRDLVSFDKSRNVPYWIEYYPSLKNATDEQKQFYEHWLKEFEKGNYIDIEGNITYVFLYLYSIIERFTKDRNANYILKELEKVKQAYGEYDKLFSYASIWESDINYFLNDFNKVWEMRKKQGIKYRLEDIINIRTKCDDTSIDGEDFFKIFGKNYGLSKFGKEHKEEMISLISSYLDNYQKKYGKNFIELFCERFDFKNLTEEDLVELKKYYTSDKDYSLNEKFHYEEKKRFEEMKKSGINNEIYTYGYRLFSGVRLSNSMAIKINVFVEGDDFSIKTESPGENIPSYIHKAVPPIVSGAIYGIAKEIVRECENKLR
jgi:transcription initiation factor TFIIIB Brf1 subunit/transcription initiation factor TFIIB